MTKVENAVPSVIQKALSSVRIASICQSVATDRPLLAQRASRMCHWSVRLWKNRVSKVCLEVQCLLDTNYEKIVYIFLSVCYFKTQ